MFFALWDKESRNLIADFDTEAEALTLVREAAQRYGQDYLQTIVLVQEDSRGRSTTLAMGADALLKRVDEKFPHHPLT